jgi:hypothetical protein
VTDPKDPEPADDTPLDALIEGGWTIESAEELALGLDQLLTAHGLAIA